MCLVTLNFHHLWIQTNKRVIRYTSNFMSHLSFLWRCAIRLILLSVGRRSFARNNCDPIHQRTHEAGVDGLCAIKRRQYFTVVYSDRAPRVAASYSYSDNVVDSRPPAVSGIPLATPSIASSPLCYTDSRKSLSNHTMLEYFHQQRK